MHNDGELETSFTLECQIKEGGLNNRVGRKFPGYLIIGDLNQRVEGVKNRKIMYL